MRVRLRLGCTVVLCTALSAACELPSFGAPDPASEEGGEVLSLWQGYMVAAIAVAAIVWGLLVFVLVRYRRRNDDVPRQNPYNVPVEVLYTLVPVIVVAGLFAASVRTEHRVTRLRTGPDVTIEVVGFQWQWRFAYASTDVVVDDADGLPELVLPVGQRVRFQLESADVAHSFWVPAFLEKRDLIPGVENAIDITPTVVGTYDGRCAEYCGLDHWRMSFTVRVVPVEEYEAWLAAQGSAG